MNLASRLMRLLAVVILWTYALGGYAQAWRDPTAEPPQMGGVPAGEGASGSDVLPLSVIVVNGRPHVIMGTRLYAPGQKLGQARIERITETEIWLREGAVLRKVPRYQGIERRSVPSTVAPGCAAGTAQPSTASQGLPRNGSCTKVQP